MAPRVGVTGGVRLPARSGPQAALRWAEAFAPEASMTVPVPGSPAGDVGRALVRPSSSTIEQQLTIASTCLSSAMIRWRRVLRRPPAPTWLRLARAGAHRLARRRWERLPSESSGAPPVRLPSFRSRTARQRTDSAARPHSTKVGNRLNGEIQEDPVQPFGNAPPTRPRIRRVNELATDNNATLSLLGVVPEPPRLQTREPPSRGLPRSSALRRAGTCRDATGALPQSSGRAR